VSAYNIPSCYTVLAKFRIWLWYVQRTWKFKYFEKK